MVVVHYGRSLARSPASRSRRRERDSLSARFRQINRGGAAVGLLLDLERELLPFVEGSHARLLDGADMDEDVLSPLSLIHI